MGLLLWCGGMHAMDAMRVEEAVAVVYSRSGWDRIRLLFSWCCKSCFLFFLLLLLFASTLTWTWTWIL